MCLRLVQDLDGLGGGGALVDEALDLVLTGGTQLVGVKDDDARGAHARVSLEGALNALGNLVKGLVGAKDALDRDLLLGGVVLVVGTDAILAREALVLTHDVFDV